MEPKILGVDTAYGLAVIDEVMVPRWVTFETYVLQRPPERVWLSVLDEVGRYESFSVALEHGQKRELLSYRARGIRAWVMRPQKRKPRLKGGVSVWLR